MTGGRWSAARGGRRGPCLVRVAGAAPGAGGWRTTEGGGIWPAGTFQPCRRALRSVPAVSVLLPCPKLHTARPRPRWVREVLRGIPASPRPSTSTAIDGIGSVLHQLASRAARRPTSLPCLDSPCRWPAAGVWHSARALSGPIGAWPGEVLQTEDGAQMPAQPTTPRPACPPAHWPARPPAARPPLVAAPRTGRRGRLVGGRPRRGQRRDPGRLARPRSDE